MITTKNLTFGYSSKRNVLKSITLELGEGHIHGLLGCNGIGKTTLLKIICGIMRPTEGEVLVDGIVPSTRKPQLFSELMIIPEEFSLPNISLECYAKVTSPLYPRFDMGQMRGYCQELGVDVEEKLHSMSMGQRKKAYIAFALACNVKMLVMDEPTAMLDPNGRKEVIKTLHELNEKENVTVLLITHYMDEVIGADKVIVMDDGKIVMQGTPREVFSRVEKMKSYRLDVPQVTELAWELKKAGMPMPDGILTVEEFTEAWKQCQ